MLPTPPHNLFSFSFSTCFGSQGSLALSMAPTVCSTAHPSHFIFSSNQCLSRPALLACLSSCPIRRPAAAESISTYLISHPGVDGIDSSHLISSHLLSSVWMDADADGVSGSDATCATAPTPSSRPRRKSSCGSPSKSSQNAKAIASRVCACL